MGERLEGDVGIENGGCCVGKHPPLSFGAWGLMHCTPYFFRIIVGACDVEAFPESEGTVIFHAASTCRGTAPLVGQRDGIDMVANQRPRHIVLSSIILSHGLFAIIVSRIPTL